MSVQSIKPKFLQGVPLVDWNRADLWRKAPEQLQDDFGIVDEAIKLRSNRVLDLLPQEALEFVERGIRNRKPLKPRQQMK